LRPKSLLVPASLVAAQALLLSMGACAPVL